MKSSGLISGGILSGDDYFSIEMLLGGRDNL